MYDETSSGRFRLPPVEQSCSMRFQRGAIREYAIQFVQLGPRMEEMPHFAGLSLVDGIR